MSEHLTRLMCLKGKSEKVESNQAELFGAGLQLTLKIVKHTDKCEIFDNCELRRLLNNCFGCRHNSENDLCFVQWYEIIDENVHTADEVDKRVGRIRLWLYRSLRQLGATSSNNEYGYNCGEQSRFATCWLKSHRRFNRINEKWTFWKRWFGKNRETTIGRRTGLCQWTQKV